MKRPFVPSAVVEMADVLLLAAAGILALVGAGLVGLRRAKTPALGMMGLQLLGSGCVAVLLLLCVALDMPALADAALTLALLAGFACAALYGTGGAIPPPKAGG